MCPCFGIFKIDGFLLGHRAEVGFAPCELDAFCAVLALKVGHCGQTRNDGSHFDCLGGVVIVVFIGGVLDHGMISHGFLGEDVHVAFEAYHCILTAFEGIKSLGFCKFVVGIEFDGDCRGVGCTDIAHCHIDIEFFAGLYLAGSRDAACGHVVGEYGADLDVVYSREAVFFGCGLDAHLDYLACIGCERNGSHAPAVFVGKSVDDNVAQRRFGPCLGRCFLDVYVDFVDVVGLAAFTDYIVSV